MHRRILVILIAVIGMFSGLKNLKAQSNLQEFTMKDTVVTICKGILKDSEEGEDKKYSHNEDYKFTINTGGRIDLIFIGEFCIENNVDFVTFFNGPDINSPQIGPRYTGFTPPPTITANSGFLTVHFTSDEDVAYCGFEAQWTTNVPAPIPPVLSVDAPACNSTTFDIDFDKPIICTAINPGAFTIGGSQVLSVVDAIPNACSNDSATSTTITVNNPMNQNCTYSVGFNIQLPDRCDSLYNFSLSTSFTINTCPLTLSIEASSDTICPGECVDIEAIVDGCLNYSYTWDNGLPSGPGPHNVCPTSTTVYEVVVKDQDSGVEATETKEIFVADPYIVDDDQNICQSADSIQLTANPSGGLWIGNGIINNSGGWFHPDTAGPGVHTIYYRIGRCLDSIVLTVDSIDAGDDEAACPGSPPFQVGGFGPSGGTWSGSNISSSGLFTPNTNGVFTVTYSEGNCTDTKDIYVEDLILDTGTDTVCQSEFPFKLVVTPPGGRWSGNGIVDDVEGIFHPDIAGGGLHQLKYDMHGCDESKAIFVKGIDAGRNFNACPSQQPFRVFDQAIPSDGIWSGAGITDPNNGTFNPSLGTIPRFDFLLFTSNSIQCTDTVFYFVGETSIDVDTMFFCLGIDGIVILNRDNVGNRPFGGQWMGNGVTSSGQFQYSFTPVLAGVGEHVLIYDNNECSDSIHMIVYPQEIGLEDTTVCSSQSPFVIKDLPPGGRWLGRGIIDREKGIFDPSIPGPGVSNIRFTTPTGCGDTMKIEVYEFQEAKIGGINGEMCFSENNILLNLVPKGGILIGGTTDSTYNPSIEGPGVDTLVYYHGEGVCFTADTVIFEVYPKLTTNVEVTRDTICDLFGTKISVFPNGGHPKNVKTYNWNQGLPNVSSHVLNPQQSTLYIVVTSDGCSEDVVDSIPIFVHPGFTPVLATSELQCAGEPGFATVSITQPGDYDYTWFTNPIQKTESINLEAGKSVSLSITENNSGCKIDTLVKIPSYTIVEAQFSPNPNMECIPFDRNPVTFIDVSNNAVKGTWIINGEEIPYEPGINPSHSYEISMKDSIHLEVFNEGGCRDEFMMEICVLGPSDIFLPNAFSPNHDGINDVFYVRGREIAKMELLIYDRWGERIFVSRSQDLGWDGTFKGEIVTADVYFYSLVVETKNGEEFSLKGEVIVVR